jgi:hypothetical protein
MPKKKKVKPVVQKEPRIPAIDVPQRNRNCSTCSWARNGMCPLFGNLKDGGDVTVKDNGCLRHNFAVKGDEW